MSKLIYIWKWCKINWKFLIGISIPIIISILLRRGNSTKIYREASEARKQELDVANKAHKMESEAKRSIELTHDEAVDTIVEEYRKEIERSRSNHDRTISEIDTAEKATSAIKEKLE